MLFLMLVVNAGNHLHLSHNLNFLVIVACLNHNAPNLSWESFHGTDSIRKNFFPFFSFRRPGF